MLKNYSKIVYKWFKNCKKAGPYDSITVIGLLEF